MPYINLAIRHMTTLQNKVVFFVLTVILPMWTTFSFEDPMNLLNGYSMIWIVLLYVVGALIKEIGLEKIVSKRNAIVLYFVCVILSWFAKAGCEALFGDAFQRITYGNGFLLRYVSPTVVWSAIALVVYFAHIKELTPRMIPVVTWMSKVSFGIFLIHTHHIIRTRYYVGLFADIGSLPTYLFVAVVFGSTIIIYLACGLLEYIRQCIFDWLRVNQITKCLYQKGRAFLIRWLNIALKNNADLQ